MATLKTLEMDLYPGPDLCLTTKHWRSTEILLDFMACFLYWHAVYIVKLLYTGEYVQLIQFAKENKATGWTWQHTGAPQQNTFVN